MTIIIPVCRMWWKSSASTAAKPPSKGVHHALLENGHRSPVERPCPRVVPRCHTQAYDVCTTPSRSPRIPSAAIDFLLIAGELEPQQPDDRFQCSKRRWACSAGRNSVPCEEPTLGTRTLFC